MLISTKRNTLLINATTSHWEKKFIYEADMLHESVDAVILVVSNYVIGPKAKTERGWNSCKNNESDSYAAWTTQYCDYGIE